MATFVSTIKFTDQGIKAIAKPTKRAAALKAAARKMKVKVRRLLDTGAVRRAARLRCPG